MTSTATPGESLSSTAYLTAYYRAVESERADALFHDPYARLLAGEEGMEIEQNWPYVKQEFGSIAVRTKIYDDTILRLLEQEEIDTVLNLAAGLDSRPYRLSLPSSLRWIEVDLPGILTYKAAKLADARPACKLERVALNLLDEDAREQLFARVNSEAKQVLVLAEGLLAYLLPEQVSALAHDIFDQASFRWWLTEFLPAYVLMSGPTARNDHAYKDEKIQFAPEDGLRFFEERGWKLVKYYALLSLLRRLKRNIRLGWLLRMLDLLAYLTTDDRKSYRHAGGFVLLERDVPEEDQKQKKSGWLRLLDIRTLLRFKGGSRRA